MSQTPVLVVMTIRQRMAQNVLLLNAFRNRILDLLFIQAHEKCLPEPITQWIHSLQFVDHVIQIIHIDCFYTLSVNGQGGCLAC